MCLFLPSCTLAVPQLDGLLSVLGGAQAVKAVNATTDLQWTAQVNGSGRLMSLYTLEAGGFIFVSEEGDLISFDGWVVTSLKGFGLPGLLTIKDENGARVIENNGNFDSEVECGEWRSVSIEMVKSWKQSCKGLTTDNEIVLNDDGDVIQVRQVISFDGSEVVLKKL